MKERRRQGRNQDLHKDSAQIAPQKRILLTFLHKGEKPDTADLKADVAKNCGKGKTLSQVCRFVEKDVKTKSVNFS